MTDHEQALRYGLSLVLGIVLVSAAIGLVVYVVAPITSAPPYTELYVLNEEGHAANYTSNLSVGERSTIIVGIENHEHQTETYTLVVERGGETVDKRDVDVERGATWRGTVTFSFDSPGKQRLQVFLYRGVPSGEPYRDVYLQVRVTEEERQEAIASPRDTDTLQLNHR